VGYRSHLGGITITITKTIAITRRRRRRGRGRGRGRRERRGKKGRRGIQFGHPGSNLNPQAAKPCQFQMKVGFTPV